MTIPSVTDVVAKIEPKRNSADEKMLIFITCAEPNRLVNLPRENLEIIAAPDRSDNIAPITTGLIPNSVPTKGRITTRTSLVAATVNEVQIAGLIPGL